MSNLMKNVCGNCGQSWWDAHTCTTQIGAPQARAYMPILGTQLLIPMKLLNEEWAQKNHGQSLERLAQRGGLSLEECAAIARKRPWQEQSLEEAIKDLNKASYGVRL